MEGAVPVDALHENIKFFVSSAKAAGLDTCLAGESAIVPIMIGDDKKAFAACIRLLKKGVFVPPAVFPAVAHGQSRLRFSICATHNKEQLKYAVETLSEVMGELSQND